MSANSHKRTFGGTFAKQSKGHITIYSEVGQGTTVKLYMPRSGEDIAKEGPKDEAREFAREAG